MEKSYKENYENQLERADGLSDANTRLSGENDKLH